MTAGNASLILINMVFDVGCIQPFMRRFFGAHEEAVTMIPVVSVAFERQGKLMIVQLQTPRVGFPRRVK